MKASPRFRAPKNVSKQRLCFLALFLLCAAAVCPAQQPTGQSTQSGGTGTNDEAAKAAERRWRFELQKKKLEEGEPRSIAPETEVSGDQTLFVSPAVTNMLVGEVREFCAFDINGKILTQNAEWTVDDPGVVTLNTKEPPNITTKQQGKAILRARIGSRTAEASITVLEGDSMPVGTIKWSVPGHPGYQGKQIVQAVPRERGPDLYTVEENAEGKSMVRAWTSEGIFLWMRKFDRRIVNAVPH